PLPGIERLLSFVKQKSSVRVIILGLPTLLAVFYFTLLAVNRFESVSTFVVRSPSGTAVSEIANLVQGSGVISSADYDYIVHEYMVSRDAMHELIAKDGLLEILGKSGFDPLWRLPGLFGRPSDERLFLHYARFISVSFDKTTGISTLKVQAFRTEDAQ